MSDKELRPAAGASSTPPADGEDAVGGEAPLSVVSGLMEERRRYEAWLTALESRRDTTPERVFARVHADYTTRLEAVIGQLTSHTDGLRGELTSLAERLATLKERQQQVREERAEAELRAHVGELSTTDWEQTAAAGDARIAALTASYAALEEELRRTRELLTDAERPVTTGSSMAAIPEPKPASAPPAVADAAEADLHVPAASTPAAPPTPPAAAPVRARNSSFDELAFLSSVVDTPAPPEPEEPAAPPAAPAPPIRPVPSPPRRDSFAMRAAADGIENLDGASAPSLVARTGGDKPLAANISGNNPIIIKEKAVDGTKTLKCAECGSMNYPTEWYCERCGAELASL